MKTLIVVGSIEAQQAMQRHVPADVRVACPGQHLAGYQCRLLLVMAPMVTEAEREWFDRQVGPCMDPLGDMYPLWHMPAFAP